ncbi:MMPL family transporter [Streptomyces sp. NPDC056670]|uniref:MMPL family transporter n=1 Tax=Streptomyces sp. NPDC056670 TaxID=3345904 RepID=UPI00369ED5DB
MRHTTAAIASAGLVLAGSFATLATSPGNEQMAFAMALGILLSALVLSLVLVPAVAALLGRALWWPVRPGAATDACPEDRTEAIPAREAERARAY